MATTDSSLSPSSSLHPTLPLRRSMESMASSQSSKSILRKLSASLSPMKPLVAAAAAPSPSKVGISQQIETPEKAVELPRRGRNRSVAYSVKEVKRVAQGLGRREKELVADRSADDLASLEEELAGDRASKPVKPKIPVKLPEKYEMLGEFFNCMESSIRLIRLKGVMSTFSNICLSIQHLSERRFTYGHLAQLKYIMPEAILVKNVLVHNEDTCCMKPELQVTLQIDDLDKSSKRNGESGYTLLRKIFRERLVDFSKEHPEEDDVPEDTLPYPFNRKKPTMLPNMAGESMNLTRSELPANSPSLQHLAVHSHMPRSFQGRFSKKVLLSDSEKTPLACIDKSPPPPKDDPLLSVVSSTAPFASPSTRKTADEEKNELLKSGEFESAMNTSEGTPAKLVSAPASFMSATPELRTPKRSRPSKDDDSPQVKKSATRTTRTKLFQTPKKNTKAEDEVSGTVSSSAEDDLISILPKSLLQSIREKEKKAMAEKEAGVPEAQRRQKMLSRLPDVFDLIHLIYQSGNRSIMTKRELIHSIISSHRKIVDRTEVDEQLRLLCEIAPDWISEKTASSGESLIHVDKISIPEEIRQRLVNAE